MRIRSLNKLFSQIDRSTIDRYSEYIETIHPKTPYERFRRWLFAFCSIHSTWESNVRAYSAINNLTWLGSSADLFSYLKRSRTGLYNYRTKSIYDFSLRFGRDPGRYSFKRRRKCSLRDELSSELFGIGLAKVSFAAELINHDYGAICLDRHVLRWMTGSDDLNGKMTATQYNELETKWKNACKKRSFHPVAARHALWDIGKNRFDMRYWAHVFE